MPYLATLILAAALASSVPVQADKFRKPVPWIEVDLSKLEPGQMMALNVVGGPFHIVRRTEGQITLLEMQYGDRELRSGDPRYFVVKAFNVRSNCILGFVRPGDPRWKGRKVSQSGGFADVCSCAEYDLTGRLVVPGCAAPSMLDIPPHEFLGPDRVRVGRAPEA